MGTPLYLQTLDGETTRWRDEVGTAEDRRGSKEIAHNAVPGGPEPHANGNQPAYACAGFQYSIEEHYTNCLSASSASKKRERR